MDEETVVLSDSDVSEGFFDDFSDPAFIDGFENITLPPYFSDLQQKYLLELQKNNGQLPPFLEKEIPEEPPLPLIKIDLRQNKQSFNSTNVAKIFANDFFDSDEESTDDPDNITDNQTVSMDLSMSSQISSTIELESDSVESVNETETNPQSDEPNNNKLSVDPMDFSILPVITSDRNESSASDEPISKKRRQLLLLEHARNVLENVGSIPTNIRKLIT